MNKNRKRYSKKTGISAMALSIAAAMARYPVSDPGICRGKRTGSRADTGTG